VKPASGEHSLWLLSTRCIGHFRDQHTLDTEAYRFRVLTKPSRFPSRPKPTNHHKPYKENLHVRQVRRAQTELSLHQARRPPLRRPSWSSTPTADAGCIAVPAATSLSAPEFNQNTHSLQPLITRIQITRSRPHRGRLHRAIRTASRAFSTRSSRRTRRSSLSTFG